MKQKAVLVGINYPNTSHQLYGCVNDVLEMREILLTRFNFSPTNVRLILDNGATTKNILDSLNWLVQDAEPGDVLFFHYSGHGSQIYSKPSKNDPEPDGVDEILCPIDLDWKTKLIRDDDLKNIFDAIPNGCFFTSILDCCNSGSGMDHQNSYQPTNSRELQESVNEKSNNRFLPPPIEIMEQLASRSTTQQAIHIKKTNNRNINATGVMISGCRANQTSADAVINGKPMGACTYFISKALKDSKYKITYKALVDKINTQLASHGFTQRPELNGNPIFYTQHFLQGPGVVSIRDMEDNSESNNKITESPKSLWTKLRLLLRF